MLSPSFGVSRTFDATLDEVWTAFTDAAQLAQWTPPPGATILHGEARLEEGGAFRLGLAMPDGVELWGRWIVRKIEPPSRMSFALSMTDEAGTPIRNPIVRDWPMTLRGEFRLALQGGGATLTINLSPQDPTEAEAAAFRKAFAVMSEGWERALDRLDHSLSRP